VTDDKLTNDGNTPPPIAGSRNPERKERLGSELRDNLKRRKGQSRMRGEDMPPGAASRNARKTLIDPD
jgi:hypothetical protein